jgi:Putative Actinobacterial Holin-X, holin superfamily III
MNSSFDTRSIPELFGDALAQLAKLVQNEVDLARAELSQKAGAAVGALKLIAAGAVIIIPALVLVLFAVAAGLIQLGLSSPLAYLCTGLGAGIGATVLIWMGFERLSADNLKPSMTIDQIHRDQVAAKELMR